jgi:hypothetical protein
MMATTHALAGMVLASVTVALAPEHAPLAVGAAAAGGAFPDLDLAGRHRRTLHFPVYYSVAAVALTALAVARPAPVTVALATFFAAVGLHSVTDAFGGGLELKPWEGTSDRAVYDHHRGLWVRPRRWIRYDGALEDVALAAILAAPTFAVGGPAVRRLVLALVAVSVVYGVLRKPLVAVAAWLVAVLPPSVLEWIPGRFVEELSE